MLETLKQPYPYLHRGKNLIKVTLLIFVIGFLFEYLIIPFQRTPDEHKYAYAIISLFHVGVATIVYFLFFWILGFFVQDDDWKFYKEISSLAALLLFIGLGEWAIRDIIYNHPNNWALYIMFEEIWHAYLSGSVIIILVLTINYNLYYRRNLAYAADLHLSRMDKEKNDLVSIETQSKAEDFILDPSRLVCIKADGNYAEFYINSENGIEKLIKRITLQSAEDQLEGTHLIKTHRAFIVNPFFVTKIDGNAQGYQLTLGDLPFSVPVSRKHIQAFNDRMK